MSMQRRRNVIVPVWFAMFAIAAFALPSGTFGWSLFLLVLGLTVPAMVYALWQDPSPQRVSVGRQRTDAQRTT
jgi:hypothetical protein